MSNQSNGSRDNAGAAQASSALGQAAYGTADSGLQPNVSPVRESSVSQEFANPHAGGAISGQPQKSIEPHISAANAAGIFAEGSRFGVYIVGPCIGHGGMARIYRAEHEGLRRQVALKVLTDGFAQEGEGRKRFLREARIAAAIKHPNVANIFDVGVQDGIPYLVMELLEGEDLESLLHSKGSLDEGSIIDIIVPVVAGLSAVHDANVVHRDLKPGNIFLAAGRNDEIEPKLLDFGISKASGKGHMKLTSATKGLLMGTPFYMSPEAIQGADMTPLSDQYSLGVLLYECATGINPFSADSFAETVRRITTGEYPSLAAHPSRPSRRLVRIIERAMAVSPGDRFPDLRALGRELLTLAGQRTRITWSLSFGELAVPPKNTTSTVVVAERTAEPVASIVDGQFVPSAPPPPNGRRGTMAAMAFGGVAFVAAAIVLLRPSVGQPPPLPVIQMVESTAALRPAVEPEPVGATQAPGRANNEAEAAEIKAAVATRDVAPSKPTVSTKVKRARRKTKTRRRTTRLRKSQRRAVVADTGATKKQSGGTRGDTPDWAVDLGDGDQRAKGPSSGTNNAPIFD